MYVTKCQFRSHAPAINKCHLMRKHHYHLVDSYCISHPCSYQSTEHAEEKSSKWASKAMQKSPLYNFWWCFGMWLLQHNLFGSAILVPIRTCNKLYRYCISGDHEEIRKNTVPIFHQSCLPHQVISTKFRHWWYSIFLTVLEISTAYHILYLLPTCIWKAYTLFCWQVSC